MMAAFLVLLSALVLGATAFHLKKIRVKTIDQTLNVYKKSFRKY